MNRRKIILLFALMAIVALYSGTSCGIKNAEESGADTLAWLEDGEGLERALAEQKMMREPIALFFYTTWCPYCRKFDQSILKSDEVKRGLSEVTKVRIDLDKEPELANEYGIRAIPQFLVRRPNSQISKISTETTPGQFLESCERAGLEIKY